MNYLNDYIRSLRFKKINQKFDIVSSDFEKIIIFNQKETFFKNEKIKEFYKKYEKELNSFKMDDLMKIFEETGICIYRTLRYLSRSDNSNSDIGGFVVQPTSVYYWNNDNYSKIKFDYTKKKYRKQKKEFERENDMCRQTGEYDYFLIDMEFVSYVDKLGKDDIGIYIVNNNKKEYVCLFEELD